MENLCFSNVVTCISKLIYTAYYMSKVHVFFFTMLPIPTLFSLTAVKHGILKVISVTKWAVTNVLGMSLHLTCTSFVLLFGSYSLFINWKMNLKQGKSICFHVMKYISFVITVFNCAVHIIIRSIFPDSAQMVHDTSLLSDKAVCA